MAKCKNCKNFFRSFEDVKPFYWCEKIADSPYGETERECSYYKPQTNADRIRSMTDEELAISMMCPNEMGLAEIECDKIDVCNCYECLLNWLGAESEEKHEE